MYNGIHHLDDAICAIEDSLTEDIDFAGIAMNMGISLYEFRRIFSFIVGCPLSEYVRKRRLSVAACEIMANKKCSLQRISEKYGYSTEAAFSKAFRDLHGISPTALQRESGSEINLFTRPRFDFIVSGRELVKLSIITDSAYGVKGLSMQSPHTDTCCCDAVWSRFYDEEHDASLTSSEIYASYDSDGELVLCTVGERTELSATPCNVNIPSATWASFRMNTTDDDAVNRKYSEILYEILPSAGVKRRLDVPTVEVFPRDMSAENFEWEIRIPIEGV